MDLRLVGAGVGRTGTHSLKAALERLLGGPCYHMVECFQHPEHVPLWTAGFRGEPVDWSQVFEGYVATVDWPGGGLWREILAVNPDAHVLLSTRESTDVWYRSAASTIFVGMGMEPPEGMEAWFDMAQLMMRERFAPEFPDEASCRAAYERHNAAVRAEVPPEQLIDWQPGDGWEPICAALGVPVPDEPFPHTNTTAEFRAMRGWD
jgi:hypothetical protein